ncbi:MAG: PhnD/SsuA/transferrin family substrate-binding protein [Desulfobulbaceae bacterium]|nr:PhnD/SsuA/transferrin family substrate-binding protein [Desulfobulbaceae bacterium]
MTVKAFLRIFTLLLCLVGLGYPMVEAAGMEPVKIGVLAFRPKAQELADWQPLAAVLKQAIPERDFAVEVFTYAELNQAIASRQLDFVLTNPGHYVLLKTLNGFSSPLATLASTATGRTTSVFGGVIFCRADQGQVNVLSDIKGKTVAIASTESLGGYQMQAYELIRAGIRMPQGVKLLTTDMPHDKVVEAVLSGRAEVGFVRSGVLEGMTRNGKLDPKQLKVLQPQNHPGFPQQVSTPLYPEWPFTATPRADKDLARRVAAALFLMADNSATMATMGSRSFVAPADYSPVEEVLRELRLPPFDVAPQFTWQDIWARYHWQISGSALAFAVIAFLGVNLLFANRRLATKQLLLLEQQHKLQVNEEKFRTVADHTLGWEYWQGPNEELFYMSPSCQGITGYSREEFTAEPDLLKSVIHPDDRHKTEVHRHDIGNQEDGTLNFRVVRRDGGIRWIEHICHPVWSSDGVFKGRRVSNRDITERKQIEESRRELSAIVERSLNEIYLFDAETLRFRHVNLGALRNLQYTLAELKNMTPVDIKAELTETSFRALVQPLLAEEQDVLVFETVHRRADASLYPVEVHLQLMGSGQQRTFLAVVFDITERKRMEAEKAKIEASFHQLQKSESLGRMAGAIAHNYNNMLAAVIGNLELGINELPPGTHARTYMCEAMKASRRAAEISGLMLTYLGHTFTKEEALDLSEVCNRNLPTLTDAMPPEVALTTDLATPGPIISANTQEIMHLLTNLTTNAWEALPQGGGAIHLAVKTVAAAAISPTHRFPLDWQPQDIPYACLEVSDTGCGIAAEDIDKIFDPFYTSKFTGRGLGLPVVLGIIRARHGAITVHSQTTGGSVFRVFFPLATESVLPTDRPDKSALGQK